MFVDRSVTSQNSIILLKLRETLRQIYNLDKMNRTDLRIGEVENKFVSYNSSSSWPFSLNSFEFSLFLLLLCDSENNLLNELIFVDDILKSEVIKLEFVFIYRYGSSYVLPYLYTVHVLSTRLQSFTFKRVGGST